MAKTTRASRAPEIPKCEQSCVVCARCFWSDHLSSVRLFACKSNEVDDNDVADDGMGVSEEAGNQQNIIFTQDQHNHICSLLSARNYGERWPHIWNSELGKQELLGSSVQSPTNGERLLLHRDRVPGAVDSNTKIYVADEKAKVFWCKDCRGSLHRKVPQMPKYALANDNWGGRIHPDLKNLSPGTSHLLPRARVCVDITVLGEKHLSKDLKQTGLIGNHIIVPQASPTQILKSLPPSASDCDALADRISFVTVATPTSDFHKAKLWNTSRKQYLAAVKTLQALSLAYHSVVIDEEELAKLPETDAPALQLLHVTQSIAADDPLVASLNQLGPADSNEASLHLPVIDDVEMPSDPVQAKESPEQIGRCAALIGGAEDADDNLAWLRMKQQLEVLCEPSLQRGSQTLSHAEEYFRLQKVNVAEAAQLDGQDKVFAVRTLDAAKSLQVMAARAGRTKWDSSQEDALLGKPIEALVIPGGGELIGQHV